MKQVLYSSLIVILMSTFFQCSSQSRTSPAPNNPVPTLSSLEPASKVSHLPDFTLTVKGTSFVSGSRVVFDGAVKPTTYVNSTELACDITSGDITPGSALISGGSGLSGIMNTTLPVLVRNPAPGGGDSNTISFSIRDNHNFFDPGMIVDNEDPSYYPKIALDNDGNINIVWMEWNMTGDIYACFSRSTDGGSSWSPVVNISNNTESLRPAIVVDSTGNINVVWEDKSPGNSEIFFRRTTNNGADWSTPKNISGNSVGSYVPSITVDSTGNLYVAWIASIPGNNEIFFSLSSDGGRGWDTPVNISENSGHSNAPVIGSDDSENIYVVWSDKTPGDSDIFFRRSSDGGSSWSPRLNITQSSTNSIDPAMAVDSRGNINLAWTRKVGLMQSIVFSRSTDTGNSWSPPLKISNESGEPMTAAIATDSAGNINLAWHDYGPGNFDIMFCRSTDGGTHWSATTNISHNTGFSKRPAMAVDHIGNINVAWENRHSGRRNIFFAGSTR